MEEKSTSKIVRPLSLAHFFLLITLALYIAAIPGMFGTLGIATVIRLALMAVPVLLFFSENKNVRTVVAVIALAVGAYSVFGFVRTIINCLRIGIELDIFVWLRILPGFASGLVMLFCGLALLTENKKLETTRKIVIIAALFTVVCFMVAGYATGNTALSALICEVCNVLGYGMLPGGEFAGKRKEKVKFVTAVIVMALVIVLVFVGALGAYVPGTGGGGGNSRVCKSCGRTFTDSSNTMNIAKTGMCNNCYGNYQWGSSAIGK